MPNVQEPDPVIFRIGTGLRNSRGGKIAGVLAGALVAVIAGVSNHQKTSQ
jgi:hypothetical protein